MIASLHTRSDQLISTLRTLEKSPRAAGDLERIFGDESLCLRNMDEAIQAIQEGRRLVEGAEAELRTLISRVERLEEVREEAEAVREVASILRALQPLLTKISPTQPTSLCSSSPDRTFSYLRSLAASLQQLAADPKLRLSSEQENEIARSGYILVTVTSFLEDLRDQARLFSSSCFAGKENTEENIRALGNIMASLAVMAETLGEDSAAQNIRRGERLAQSIVVS